jgi:hypothetical protein
MFLCDTDCTHHMHINNIQIPEHFGFWEGVSTENVAFSLTNSVFKPIKQNMYVGGIFCDLATAFGSVNHSASTRNRHDLPGPVAKLLCFQKSAYYSGINIFSDLPCSLKSLTIKRCILKQH